MEEVTQGVVNILLMEEIVGPIQILFVVTYNCVLRTLLEIVEEVQVIV